MIENYIWISNHEINKEDKISIEEFLNKVKNLYGLRTRTVTFITLNRYTQLKNE